MSIGVTCDYLTADERASRRQQRERSKKEEPDSGDEPLSSAKYLLERDAQANSHK